MRSQDPFIFDAQRGLHSTIEISWSKERTGQIEAARRKFEEYTRQGWLAFTITSDNRKVQVYEFDPTLERVFLVPLAEGG